MRARGLRGRCSGPLLLAAARWAASLASAPGAARPAGLLNATFGNATEMIVSILAIRGGLLRVVQARPPPQTKPWGSTLCPLL